MASVVHLVQEIPPLMTEVESRNRYREVVAREEFLAARLIQAIWRGHNIRQRVAYWHEMATLIQKIWRGYLGRLLYRKFLEQAVYEMCEQTYKKMAMRLQALWRGWLTRKHVFDYYRLKKWIAEVKVKTENFMDTCANQQKDDETEMLDAMEEEAQKWVLFIAFKLHHLLRTQTCSGIYSLNYTIELSQFEKILKSIKFKRYMDVLHKKYKQTINNQKGDLTKFKMQCHKKCQYIETVYRHRNVYAKGDSKEIPLKFPTDLHKFPFDLSTHTKDKKYVRLATRTGPYEDPHRNINEEDPSKFLFGKFDTSRRIFDKEMLNYIGFQVNKVMNKKCCIHQEPFFKDECTDE